MKAASEAKSIIPVGMHKALAKNPITTHAMDEDGPSAIRDSDAALALFKRYGIAMLVKGLVEADGAFHHFVLVDVLPGGDKPLLRVEVVRFPGQATRDSRDESEEFEN